ncbi:MAG: hypothetical protein L7H18_02840 [Candidatus Nealsonbacteria bacterium DGGOD1a]|jgi:hypothetical protein|nr:MAG: hypothetical protein L7H18_02840 [Candidatus Nealsonbacteria bacterium DGGOD1a]
MLPQKAVDEFKRIYCRIYKIQLSDTEASEKANRFVEFYKAVYGPSKIGRIENGNETDRSNTITL